MEIETRSVDGCVILDLFDKHFCHPQTVVLKHHVAKILASGHSHLVLNLSGVEMLDSFGIAAMVSILKLCKEHQGNMTLYGANKDVNRLMEITHMDRVLDIWESEGQAVSQALG
ncbi:MAG: STAS domain-containing protein [Candidatus Melainabacteria bacterium]